MSQPALSQSPLAAVRIVLVSPAGPLNVGSIARVMKNFGLSQLVLVSPQCDPLDSEALQMAVHAKDVLQMARQVSTIPEALNGCYRAIATTARSRGFHAPLTPPDIALPDLLHFKNRDTALIFGPEDRGLSNEELTYAQQFIKIPTHPNYSALNLAQAVAICCYELQRAERLSSASDHAEALQQNDKKALRSSPLSAKQTESKVFNTDSLNDRLSNVCSPDTHSLETAPLNTAKINELEGYYQHLESVLLKVEYLYPHTAASRMRKFRQLLHKASPTSSEVALLRGILRQVEWALSESSSPANVEESDSESDIDKGQL
ncbi:MAG: RNA methyltransferase [Phormidesmis sp.]